MYLFFRTKKSVLKPLGNTVAVLALSVTLFLGTEAMAESDIKGPEAQIAQNVQGFNSKVAIKRTEMTAENKGKLAVNDNRIGAFSMEDGAMEGFYGDGEYIQREE